MLISAKEIRKILYINIAHIGDIVLSFPVTRALKAAYPTAQLDMLVSFPQGEAAYYNPYVNKVIFYRVRSWQQDRAELQSIVAMLQQQNYDLAISSCYGTVDPMMAFLTGARYRAGFAVNGGEKYSTYIVPISSHYIHETERQLQVIELLGVKADDTSIEFSLTQDETAGLFQKVPSILDSKRSKVVICPVSDEWKKKWTITGNIQLLQALSRYNHCYLAGAYRQTPYLNEINKGASNAAEVLGGCLSIGELGALIRAADLLITVDTGPMHIAQAFATPVISLFGPTDPHLWGPRRPQDIVLRAALPCSPCWDKDDDWQKNCRENRCMKEIKPETVISEAKKLLCQGNCSCAKLKQHQ